MKKYTVYSIKNEHAFILFCFIMVMVRILVDSGATSTHGPITRYVKLNVAHELGMQGTFCPPPLVSDPDMHHGTCVMHVP